MKHRLSLVQRLVLQLVLGASILWLIGVGFAAYVVDHELNEAFDENLRQSAARFFPIVISELDEHSITDQALVDFDFEDDIYVSYYALDRHNKLLFAPHDFPTNKIETSVRDGFTTIGTRRYFSLSDAKTGTRIVLVELKNQRGEIIWQSVGSLLMPLAALLPLMALLIWWTVSNTFKPVAQLRDAISRRGATDMSAADTSQYPKELAPIAEEVNQLLHRLKDALSAERSFAASSAHELRTPIAGALAQVQRLQAELKDTNGKARAKEIEASLQKLARLSEKLLQFARLEAGFARASQINNVLPIVHLVVADFDRAEATKNQVKLNLTAQSKLCAPIDPDAFAVALRNLIDNALAYREGAEAIEISISQDNKLLVTNGARKFTQQELEIIKRPFERSNAKQAGTGIGLSIVSAIVHQVGGQFQLRSVQHNGQYQFEAQLDFRHIHK